MARLKERAENPEEQASPNEFNAVWFNRSGPSESGEEKQDQGEYQKN